MGAATRRTLGAATAVWLVNTVVWTPFMLGFVMRGQHADIAGFLGTAIGEAVLPLLLLVLVARPAGIVAPLERRAAPRPVIWVSAGVIAIALAFVALRHNLTGSVLLAGVEYLVIVGPLEEWSYRGVLTRVLKDRVGLIIAAIIVSIAFALAHWAEMLYVTGLRVGPGMAESMGIIFIYALALTWIAWRSGSIAWVAIVHGLGDWLNPPGVLGALLLVVVGALGAELIRFFTVRSERSATAGAMSQSS